MGAGNIRYLISALKLIFAGKSEVLDANIIKARATMQQS